ncbi:hypothetical protein FisN_42Lh010 [Fistulifera solaris]|uniref:Uncharacterized protein n=1 Tax=Fistulifera solaris TaxID=1519565 RepID=A0A1Z5KIG7_FISSO|nr:hypothetical protein FisN_42Lh010 [Fistulifera solaris]|eukprot:GAX26093.1 hypothetical protein FisN_42Lh010 [Fistulifera solaris]
MEGDYYDNEKSLSRSFDDSEQNGKHLDSRKRQRLEAPTFSDLKGSPLSVNMPAHSASAKDRSAFHSNCYSDDVDGTSPSPSIHQHPCYNYDYSERRTSGRSYPVPPYKQQPFPHYGEHRAPYSQPLISSTDEIAGIERQPFYPDNPHHSTGHCAPVQWDPYSYHHYQHFQHKQQSWSNPISRYPSKDDSHKNDAGLHSSFQYPTKDERHQDFLQPTTPPYPYYFNSYPVYYPHPQIASSYGKGSPLNSFYPGPDGMPTHSEDIPPQRTMSLYMTCDEDRLSEYQCLARKQIEVFSATYSDLKMTVQGRNRQVLPGQVGIRCCFCSHIPVKKQARASVYYPSKLNCIYQAAQNMASVHLAKYCSFVPEDIRSELLRHMKDRKSSAGGGKEYWAVSARSLGIEECDGRLRFATAITDDSSRATQR